MTKFKIGKMKKQDKTYNFVPMDPSFGEKSLQERQKFTVALQKCAADNGFVGRVIPVWDAEDGSLNYFAPPYLQGFVSQLNLTIIKKHLKDELECDIS